MTYRPIDRNYDPEHEKAVRIAGRALRPFTYFYVIGRPVTYNGDFLPPGKPEPTWDERCDFGDLDGPY